MNRMSTTLDIDRLHRRKMADTKPEVVIADVVEQNNQKLSKGSGIGAGTLSITLILDQIINKYANNILRNSHVAYLR